MLIQIQIQKFQIYCASHKPLVLAAISHVVRKISQVTPVQFSVQLHLNSLAV